MAGNLSTLIRVINHAVIALLLASFSCSVTAFANNTKAASHKEKVSPVWTAADGWNGLVVGKHTLKQAEAVLGKVQNVEVISTEKVYNFNDAAISISLDPKSKLISMIRVSSDLKNSKLMPISLSAAERRYGQLRKINYNKSSGNTYGKPGLTIQADSSVSPEKIVWMEFSKP